MERIVFLSIEVILRKVHGPPLSPMISSQLCGIVSQCWLYTLANGQHLLTIVVVHTTFSTSASITYYAYTYARGNDTHPLEI